MPRNGAIGHGALALLLSGTVGSLLGKLIYQLQAPGRDGQLKSFEKPWASTLLMFIGMACCLPAAAAAGHLRAWLKRLEAAGGGLGSREPLLARHSGGGESAASNSDEAASASSVDNGGLGEAEAASGGTSGGAAAAGGPSRRDLLLILIPTAFDLLATVTMAVGLLYVTASVYQMMRGSEIVFAALLSRAWLGRRLNRWHLGGIALCLGGITLVGSASFLEGRGNPQASSAGATLLGMGLVVVAEAVQAAQVVVEDYFMSNHGMAPLTVVGCEGVYGAAITLCVMLPAVQLLPGREGGGVHEDSIDTLCMLRASGDIRQVAAWSVAAQAVYNVAGMLVTDSLGAVTRTVLETMRTLFVWVLNLLLFYAGSQGGKHGRPSAAAIGEPWTSHSWLQAVGFAVLVAGTLVYGHGEEVQERRLRAKLRWARLRESLAHLAHPHELQRPLRPLRICGPAHICTSLLQRAVVGRLLERLAASKAAISQHAGAAAAAEAAAVLSPYDASAGAPPEGGDDGEGCSTVAWLSASEGAAGSANSLGLSPQPSATAEEELEP